MLVHALHIGCVYTCTHVCVRACVCGCVCVCVHYMYVHVSVENAVYLHVFVCFECGCVSVE